MNLYKILIQHSAPKDSKLSMMDYLLAENEEEVFKYIDSTYNYGSWMEKVEQTWEEYSEENDLEGEDESDYIEDELFGESYKNKIIRLKGEIDDDSVDYSDSYYGITLYGWELVKENIQPDYNQLLGLGVLKQVEQ